MWYIRNVSAILIIFLAAIALLYCSGCTPAQADVHQPSDEDHKILAQAIIDVQRQVTELRTESGKLFDAVVQDIDTLNANDQRMASIGDDKHAEYDQKWRDLVKVLEYISAQMDNLNERVEALEGVKNSGI